MFVIVDSLILFISDRKEAEQLREISMEYKSKFQREWEDKFFTFKGV